MRSLGKLIKMNKGVLITLLIVISIAVGLPIVVEKTSEDSYCMSCHVHQHADNSWLQSPHMKNESGVQAHCVDCHLPPKEDGYIKYLFYKAKHGAKDGWSYMTKDTADINWEAKRPLDMAKHYVYKGSCVNCHENLFPTYLSDKGADAHYKYLDGGEKKECISCHTGVGHYRKSEASQLLSHVASGEEFKTATEVSEFKPFVEQIPGTSISFKMMPIKEGAFKMGSPDDEQFRFADEGPVRDVEVSRFWMAEIEVSWDEYFAFFSATASQGRKEIVADNEEVDGISGPTPPWGAPDQGWGKGKRPAITMSHHAAVTYCRWLSQVTGKTYRLPTEAEWEYAARGGTSGTYYFDGEPNDFEKSSIIKKIFGPDTVGIWSNTVYDQNADHTTQEPSSVVANPFGLKNMLGNVAEFCYDYYHPKIYSLYPEGVVNNPIGPSSGKEHVVRGGSFESSPRQLRVARRDFTRTKAWLVTDPQMPKSIWWYSDSKSVGFRVMCEVPETIK